MGDAREPRRGVGEGRLPYIRVWTVVRNHPKVQRLERELGIPDALGLVVRLWCWTADYHPTGDIPEAHAADAVVEAVGDLRLERDKVTEACVTCGLLDRIPSGFRVHDWPDMQSAHVEAEERRRAQARDRQRRFRERHHVTVTRDITRDGNAASRGREENRRGEESNARSPAGVGAGDAGGAVAAAVLAVDGVTDCTVLEPDRAAASPGRSAGNGAVGGEVEEPGSEERVDWRTEAAGRARERLEEALGYRLRVASPGEVARVAGAWGAAVQKLGEERVVEVCAATARHGAARAQRRGEDGWRVWSLAYFLGALAEADGVDASGGVRHAPAKLGSRCQTGAQLDQYLRASLREDLYERWFAPVGEILHDDTLYVLAPDNYHRAFVDDNYRSWLSEVVREKGLAQHVEVRLAL